MAVQKCPDAMREDRNENFIPPFIESFFKTDRNLSRPDQIDDRRINHPAATFTWWFYLIPWLLPSLVDQTIRNDPTPSLHFHYRNFNTNTDWSAPVPRIGTLILVVSST